MSESDPNPFARMHHFRGTPEERVAVETLQFERERVRHILTRFGLRKHERMLRREFHEISGKDELRFSGFCNRHPTFPFYLGASRLQNLTVLRGNGTHFTTSTDYAVHRCPYSTEPARFKMFHWVPFAAAYKAFYDTVSTEASGRKIGLVFPRKGFRDGMVIHNDDSENFWTEGYCSVYKIPKTGNRLYVQPFSALVSAIYADGRGWRPV